MKKQFKKLGKYKLTFTQWNDDYGSWRLWVNDFGAELEDFIYMCESESPEKCMEKAIKYLKL